MMGSLTDAPHSDALAGYFLLARIGNFAAVIWLTLASADPTNLSHHLPFPATLRGASLRALGNR